MRSDANPYWCLEGKSTRLDPDHGAAVTIVTSLDRFYRPVVVAVVPMWVVQVTVDQIVDMVAMRDSFMPATRAVHMARLMTAALMIGRAAIRVGGGDLQPVFIHVVAVRVVQMAVVQIVDVVAMTDRRVAAGGAVLVIVMGVMRLVAGAHGGFLRQDEAGWTGSAACASTLLSSVRTWSSERA